MCGITGFTVFNESLQSKNSLNHVIENMCNSISHRGLDDFGIYGDTDFCFGHRRLSIRDVSKGKQPMVTTYKGRKYAIVYNGEVYNVKELKKDLEKKGFTFKTTCDTEIILNAYIHYREKAPNLLNGIFAFCIWDFERKELFLCRDYYGVKPLYYTIVNGDIIFASEIKALKEHPKVKLEIDDNSMREIFGTFPSRTEKNGVYKNVFELGFGEYGVFNKEGLKTKQYYDLKAQEYTLSYDETKECVRNLLTDSVHIQMVSDVSLCTFLSGGVDSSIITAIASEKLAECGETLSTVSFDYKDNSKFFVSNDFQVDEDKTWVKKMVKTLSTKHTYLFIDTPDLISSLELALKSKDYPGMADIDSSLLCFCKEVAKEHRVALSGECADEIFGGYPWFREENFLNVSGFPWIRNIEFRESLLNEKTVKRLNIQDYTYNKYLESIKKVPTLYGENKIDARRREISYLNIKWFMPTLLERMDRMSMYNNLEVRVPFADFRLIDFLYNVPWEYKNRLGTKGLLRDAFSDTLPYDLLFRKKSPYPKTYNPEYERILGTNLKKVIENKNSPLNEYVNKESIINLIESPKDYGKPWFGQLMATPQLMAYLIQVNYWLESL
ncbi:MAG: asparagine synthase (glutamine-hydrolyzing) [Lachnospirales bacterium]